MAKHYNIFAIIIFGETKNNKTVSGKITEALLQQQLKSVLNGKEELLHIKQLTI